MKMSTGINKKSLFPLVSVPFCIVIIMRFFIIADTYHCYHRISVPVRSYLPYPVTFRRIIHYRRRVLFRIITCLVHLKCAVGNSRKYGSPDISQLQCFDIDIIKIKEVGKFISRMSRGVSQINLIFPVRHVFRIRTGAGRLYDLIRSPYYIHLIFVVR